MSQEQNEGNTLERMREFFDLRADTYDNHMLEELQLEDFYREITACFAREACFSGNPRPRLLDLGCGTGLELDGLFRLAPDMTVTGIDLSQGMLSELRQKYPHRTLQLIHASYLEVELEPRSFDCAVSTYSLHHFAEEVKRELYRRILQSLKPGGFFVEGDYVVNTPREERFYQDELERLRREQNLGDAALYHYDIPFTAQTQEHLLREAGFARVVIGRTWERTAILTAYKQ